MQQTAAIIGAGISGIATAIRLAKKGYKVRVFDKNPYPGGKMAEKRIDGYRFDRGPSLFTLPELVEELISLAGLNPGKTLKYKRLNESCRYFFDDKTLINAYADKNLFAREIESKTQESPKSILKYLTDSRQLYELTSGVFIFGPLPNYKDVDKKEARKVLTGIYKLDPLRSLHKANKKAFKSNKVIQLFDRYATYNGSDPYRAPATLKVISHLEHNLGAFFPNNGMHGIITALCEAAVNLGVFFYFNTPVQKVLHDNYLIKGIIANDHNIPFDYVFNSTDVSYFYQHLLHDHKLAKKYLKQERSSSAMIFYWGIKRSFNELGLHNIMFAGDYKAEFKSIKKKQIYYDPTVYIYISAKQVPDDAPAGCENWFVMVNTPEDSGQDWMSLRTLARQYIIQKINKVLNVNIEDHIACEDIMDPPAISYHTGSYCGAIYGASSNKIDAAFRRHPNKSKKYEGLFFTGGSVHPGGGIPLCLSSAKIATGLLK